MSVEALWVRGGACAALLVSGGLARAADPILVGQFLSHAPSAAVRMEEHVKGSFGGWQTSDLTYDAKGGHWVSLCDQNGTEAGTPIDRSHPGRYAYLITKIADPQAEPIPIWWDEKSEFDAVRRSFEGVGTGQIDFEGIAADPIQADRFFACTEGPEPWLTEMEYRPHENPTQRRMAVIRTVRISMQGNHHREAPDFDANAVWEGIALSPDGQSIYLATEWTGSASRIHRLATADVRAAEWTSTNGEPTPPKVYPKAVPVSIAGKLQGLTSVSHEGRSYLIALERDVPALHFIDLNHPDQPHRTVKLDLRAPGKASGVRIKSASPEGVAVDDTGTLALIGDPAREYSKVLESGTEETKINGLVPLVFQSRLADLLP